MRWEIGNPKKEEVIKIFLREEKGIVYLMVETPKGNEWCIGKLTKSGTLLLYGGIKDVCLQTDEEGYIKVDKINDDLKTMW